MKLWEFADKIGVFSLTRRLLKNRRNVVIMFHGTFPKRYKDVPEVFHFGMHIDELERFFVWARKEGLKFLRLEEYLAGNAGLLVTFDDGYSNNYKYALPILEKYECPVVMFVATKHVRIEGEPLYLDYFTSKLDSMNLEIDGETGDDLFYGLTALQLRALAQHPLVEIGAHTHGHLRMSSIGIGDNLSDLERCTQILYELVGYKPKVFSYPYGDYNHEVLKLVKNFGYLAAFAVRPIYNSRNSFEIPRIGIYDSDPSYLSAKLNFALKY